jgi:hypothetical protein
MRTLAYLLPSWIIYLYLNFILISFYYT